MGMNRRGFFGRLLGAAVAARVAPTSPARFTSGGFVSPPDGLGQIMTVTDGEPVVYHHIHVNSMDPAEFRRFIEREVSPRMVDALRLRAIDAHFAK